MSHQSETSTITRSNNSMVPIGQKSEATLIAGLSIGYSDKVFGLF